MLDNILNVVRTATAFLQNGVAPPNTPASLEQQMENTNHLASKKFFVIFSAIFILLIMFLMSVGFLFLLPRDHDIVLTAYSTIFTKIMEVLGLVISVYIGAQGLVELRYNSSSNASIEGQAEDKDSEELEEKDVNLNENISTNNAKEDDYNISEVEV
jgi:succinate dehydrogenase hydrophobic anchor subunit